MIRIEDLKHLFKSEEDMKKFVALLKETVNASDGEIVLVVSEGKYVCALRKP